MPSTPIVLNDLVLLACCSMYFGTGWSLLLFSFPTAKQLTVENYYEQFVPQVTTVRKFFTWMTTVMFATGGVMIVSESHRPLGEVLACSEGPLAASSMGGMLGEKRGRAKRLPAPRPVGRHSLR
jgi:hypothetical protein